MEPFMMFVPSLMPGAPGVEHLYRMHHGKVWAPSHDMLVESVYCNVSKYARLFRL